MEKDLISASLLVEDPGLKTEDTNHIVVPVINFLWAVYQQNILGVLEVLLF